jgi:superfamily II DNA or RNA helicase
MTYADYLADKLALDPPTGLADLPDLHPSLFDWQHDVVRWALRRGRAALFEDCGLGKTFQQLEWARHIPGPVLILAPLAVAEQTVAEATRFGIPALHAKQQADVRDGWITVTNYEKLAHFDPAAFTGIVLDESSILKSYDGATRTALIEAFGRTPFRLACTATPAPNDFMELGNHAEFLGVMSRTEMLATYFVHDGGETQQWRLKRHATRDFWRWVCSWAVTIRNPGDIGYDGSSWTLPPLKVHSHTVETEAEGLFLLPMEAQTLSERLTARRTTTEARAMRAAAIVNATAGPWVVWCHLNAEADALLALIPDATEIRGSDSEAAKVAAFEGFQSGRIRVLVTKPSIAGFGLNWQHCHQMAFVGLTDSWEQYYQATRRCWRFGQTHSVDVHCIAADTEGAVVANLRRKDEEADQMAKAMAEHTREAVAEALHGQPRHHDEYREGEATGPGWRMILGDCVESIKGIAEGSVDYTIFSPPFASLYTYSNSDRDMGNCRDHDDFYRHFAFLVPELYRVTRPGRLLSFHCMNLPTSKVRDGVIGLTDFRGHLIRLFVEHGWIYHSEVVIWKDPVTAMQRTKALGLLHKQIRKDSAMSRQGIPDYLVTMRKPGENDKPVSHTAEEFPVSLWQRYASPVWMDINPSDTIQYRSARQQEDEKHICPLQLGVIRRAIDLWTAPNDLILSPFAGIGSEGFVALEQGRHFVGMELKESYFRQAVANLGIAKQQTADLFAQAEA